MGLSMVGIHFTGPEKEGYVNENVRHNTPRIL